MPRSAGSRVVGGWRPCCWATLVLLAPARCLVSQRCRPAAEAMSDARSSWSGRGNGRLEWPGCLPSGGPPSRVEGGSAGSDATVGEQEERMTPAVDFGYSVLGPAQAGFPITRLEGRPFVVRWLKPAWRSKRSWKAVPSCPKSRCATSRHVKRIGHGGPEDYTAAFDELKGSWPRATNESEWMISPEGQASLTSLLRERLRSTENEVRRCWMNSRRIPGSISVHSIHKLVGVSIPVGWGFEPVNCWFMVFRALCSGLSSVCWLSRFLGGLSRARRPMVLRRRLGPWRSSLP